GRAAHFYGSVLLYRHAGLVRPLAVHENEAAHYRGARLLPARDVAELHQALVQSRAAHAISSFAAAAMPAASIPARARSFSVPPWPTMPSPRFSRRHLKPAWPPAAARIRPPMQHEAHTSSATTSLPQSRAAASSGSASSGSTRPILRTRADMPSASSARAAPKASFIIVP